MPQRVEHSSHIDHRRSPAITLVIMQTGVTGRRRNETLMNDFIKTLLLSN